MNLPPASAHRLSSSAPSSASRCDSRAATRPQGPDCSRTTKNRRRRRCRRRWSRPGPEDRAGVLRRRGVTGGGGVPADRRLSLVGRCVRLGREPRPRRWGGVDGRFGRALSGEASDWGAPRRWAMTVFVAVPEPSRRPSAAGSSMATPPAAAARAGVLPAKATTRVSWPLRKRWHRTPPVPRPLGWVLGIRRDLERAPSVPGSAPEEPAEVTTMAVAGWIDDTEEHGPRIAPELDPCHSSQRSVPGAERTSPRTGAAGRHS